MKKALKGITKAAKTAYAVVTDFAVLTVLGGLVAVDAIVGGICDLFHIY